MYGHIHNTRPHTHTHTQTHTHAHIRRVVHPLMEDLTREELQDCFLLAPERVDALIAAQTSAAVTVVASPPLLRLLLSGQSCVPDALGNVCVSVYVCVCVCVNIP